jgi:hypothetical protein
LNNPLSGTDPTGYVANTCSASTGSKIKSCETATVQQVNSSGTVVASASAIVNKGTVARWADKVSSAISDNGYQVARGPTGPNPNAYKQPNEKLSNERNSGTGSENRASYFERSKATGNGIAVGLFGSLGSVIGATPDQEMFENFGSTIYEDPDLAAGFQDGHNFGYVLGVFGMIAGAKPSASGNSSGAAGMRGAGSNRLNIPNLTERGTLANLRPNDVAVAQNTVRTLVQDGSGRYWLQSSNGTRITPSGAYDFVTLPSGKIQVSRPNSNPEFSTHLGLSGGGEVNYAGSIRFGNSSGPNRGRLSSWSNNSGHYQPPTSLYENAGLPLNLFKAHR